MYWEREHPEKRCRQSSKWTDAEKCIFMVDALAEQQYKRCGQMVVREDWWDFPVKPAFRVFWRGTPINGNIRKNLLKVVKEERLLDATAKKLGRHMYEEIGAEDRKSRKRIHKVSYAAQQRECFMRAKDLLEEQCFCEGLLGALLISSQTITETVLRVKVMAGILATVGHKAQMGGWEG